MSTKEACSQMLQWSPSVADPLLILWMAVLA